MVFAFDKLENCSVNDFPKVSGFKILLTDKDVLIITLNNKEQWGLFYALCQDLIESTRSSETHTDSVNSLIRRLRGWQIFLSSGKPKILSDEKIRGLIAELLFLELHLLKVQLNDDCLNFYY